MIVCSGGPRNPYPLAAFNSVPQPPVRPSMSPWQRHEPMPSILVHDREEKKLLLRIGVAGYGGGDVNVQERLNRQEHMIK